MPGTSRAAAAPSSQSRSSSRRAAAAAALSSGAELPAELRPSEWLTEVIPRKAPYYPQMGDEVVYLRQGHQRYLEAVRTKEVYSLTDSAEPWQKMTLRDHEFVKVIGIKYELRPPRLCCLKLALLDPEGVLTGRTFTIKYHDMPDVLDFLVLRQTYITAMSRNWQPGDRFRCMIDDGWWIGEIQSRTALSNDFPLSHFMCFNIRWDNGELEYMSPWDMEPVDESRLPTEVGGAVPVLPEELQALLYQPKPEEWLDGDRESTCHRICNGLEQVMTLPFAGPFLAPVDLNIYPQYAYVIDYPIDLQTIKARFENHFYRRITSAQFDVRYLARNAEEFNESGSEIVKHARILSELCLRVIRNEGEINAAEVGQDLFDSYRSSDEENNREGASSSRAGRSSRANGARRSQRLGAPFDWKGECRELLELLWQCDDSTPFREPVDVIEHPDYHQIIDTPMDLQTIREDLMGGNYANPEDFAKDVRLIFTNSRNYNTNKRSRIYSMTLRLSALFETYIPTILDSWKNPRRAKNRRNAGGASTSSRRPAAEAREEQRSQPETSRRPRRRVLSSSDDDNDSDVGRRNGRDRTRPATSSTSTRNGHRAVGSSSQNGTSSSPVPGPSSSYRSRRDANEDRLAASSSSSRPMRSSRIQEPVNGQRENGRPVRRRVEPERYGEEEEEDEDEEEQQNTEDSSSSSSESGDSDESNEIPLAELGSSRRNRQVDSEEDYDPRASSSRKAAKKKKKKKSNGSHSVRNGSRRKSAVSSQSSQQTPAPSASQSRSSRRRRLVSEEDPLRVSAVEEEDEHENRNQASDSDAEFLLPTKRSRAARTVQSPVEQARASSSASASATSSRRENLRRGRNNGTTAAAQSEDEVDAEEDASSDEESPFQRRTRKRVRYESDQSFQMDEPSARSSKRSRVVGSESGDEEVSRPTRSRRRGGRQNGADDEGAEEEQEHETEEPRPSRRAVAATSTTETSFGQRRSSRARVSRHHDSDYLDEDDEEEEVMPQRSQRAQQSRRNETVATPAPTTSGRFRTRRQATFDEEEEEEEPEVVRPSQRSRRRQVVHEPETEEEVAAEDDDGEDDEENGNDSAEGSEDEEEEDDDEEVDGGSDSDRPRRTQRSRRAGGRRGSSQNSLLNSSSRNSNRTRSGRLNSKR